MGGIGLCIEGVGARGLGLGGSSREEERDDGVGGVGAWDRRSGTGRDITGAGVDGCLSEQGHRSTTPKGSCALMGQSLALHYRPFPEAILAIARLV